MIIGGIFKEIGDECGDWESVLMLLMLFLCFVGLGVGYSYLFFGWIYSSATLLLLTELIYHIEPRSARDKCRGRGYGKVALKKIDSLFDAMLIVALITGGYKLVTIFNLTSVINVLLWIGLGILIILGIAGLIFGYLWINRLRDRPSKNKEKKK